MANPQPLHGHAVAVIGGATAGAEVAHELAELGAWVAVFEQHPRPYGKIEDGLPRWHVGLRRKEYDTIDRKLDHASVAFVPLTRIGRDLSFDDLAHHWGFQAVVLANGAWRDRPFPVEGSDHYVGRGLIYQNPFVIAFNHADEDDYEGPRFPFRDDALVVGGGLASIDVSKALMIETTRAALAERGIEEDFLELEVKGIPKLLDRHGLRFEDLGLAGCTLIYRSTIATMPIVEIPRDASPERREKGIGARQRLLAKAMEKYCFRIEPSAIPDGLIAEGGELVGLRLRRTRTEADETVIPLDETFERRGAYVISSIGSIPEPLEGVPMNGELYSLTDRERGHLKGFSNVFAAGNVATGRGNIVASRRHGALIAEAVAEAFLGVGDEGHERESTLIDVTEAVKNETAQQVADHVAAQGPLDPARFEALRKRVENRQQRVGYEGLYRTWIERHRSTNSTR